MDVREKLVELLKEISYDQKLGWYDLWDMRDGAEDIADLLIAHGVTVQDNTEISDEILEQLRNAPVTVMTEEPTIEVVQEWISVKDRLPEIPEGWAESPEHVLYMMKNTKTIYAGYYGEGGVWRDKYFRQYSDSRNGVDADDVLCWMYQHDLPEPPKGE